MASQLFLYTFLFSLNFYIIHAHSSKSLQFLTQLKGNPQYRSEVNELKKHLSYLEHIDQQKNHIDNATTISSRQEPRYGVSDSYNPKTNTIPFPSHYAFFPGQPKWRKRTLKYSFNKNMKEEQKQPLEQALREWASSTPFRFIRVGDLSVADIKMSFMPKYHGDGHPFVGAEAGLAHTFAPQDGRVHFDASQNWSSKGEKGRYDIKTVGLHELGHALGLGHSRVKKAVMYPIINVGERKVLHDDDVKGIKALYKF